MFDFFIKIKYINIKNKIYNNKLVCFNRVWIVILLKLTLYN